MLSAFYTMCSEAAIQLSTEITYQQASIQSQLTRVADTQTLAQTKQTAVQQQLNTQKNILATEKAALVTAKKTLDAAQQKVRDAESDYVRDFDCYFLRLKFSRDS